MANVRCRCRKCGARRTLSRRPELFRKEPKCACGGTYRVDLFRQRKETKNPCHCGAAHFPHRPGWCDRHFRGDPLL